MNRSFRNRRGVTSVIAMLFMVLIGTLALGFYTSVTTATALAKNDRRTAKALLAAESGIQFMRNRLAHTSIPPTTTAATLLDELEADLRADEIVAGNLLGAEIVRTGNVITIPMILTDSVENSGFTVTLTDIGGVGEIVCTVRGRNGSGSSVSTKGVRLDFTRQENPATIFDSAVATKGKLVVSKGSITGIPGVSSDEIIKLMSAAEEPYAIVMSGGSVGSIDGGELAISKKHDVAPTDSKADVGSVSLTGGSVHGTSNLTTILSNHLKIEEAPEFPTVDTTIFQSYATNSYTGATSGTLKNVRIPAGANPVFEGNVKIQGILYVESPNTVSFSGNSTMEGFIVFEQANTSAVNKINITGNFTYGNLPQAAEFDPLRAITGIAMLAPTTSVSMTGSLDSQIRGNMLLGNFNTSGSSNVQIEKGSIVTFDTGSSVNSAAFGGRAVKFASTGLLSPPSDGVTYSSRFLPTQGSYLELN